jgi:outer membrane protein assembly factor BamB
MKFNFIFCIMILILCVAQSSFTDECYYPQFHGEYRDNISLDKDLLKQWSDGVPKLLWKTSGIGHGFSTVSIVDGMIYTAGVIDDHTYISAFDMFGNILWQTKSGKVFSGAYPGSRGTPTIYDGKLYHLNCNGHIICLEAKTGKEIWSLNIMEKFNGRLTEWGLAESLLVDGDNIICCVGGEEISIVAISRHNGETVWTCRGIGDKPGYVSPILIDYNGLRQFVTMMSASAIGVNADTGELLWRYDHPIPYGSNISTPIYHDGHIVIFGTFAFGATKFRLEVDGNKCTIEKIWHTEELDNEHGGVVLVDGYLYGHADGNHKWRHWACLEYETGRTMYAVAGLSGATGTLTYADGMLYLLGENGDVALMPADPKGFNIISQFKLPKEDKGPLWAHPVVCGGRLYIRHGQTLYTYDVRNE